MKKIIRLLSRLFLIVGLCLFIVPVSAKDYNPTSENLSVWWTNPSGGGGQNVNYFSTTPPSYPKITKFRVHYGGDGFGKTDFTGEVCSSVSFGIKAPTDFKSIDGYNKLSNWSIGFVDTLNLRYVDVYHSNNHLYYTFYTQNKVNVTGFLFPYIDFEYSGNLNPYYTNQDYTFSFIKPVTRWVSCASISDNMIDSELDNLHSELDKSFSDINNKIDDMQSSIIENENQNHAKAEETRKGIWSSLTEGISNIGNWFSDLASSIGNFFAELGKSISDGFSNLTSSIGNFFTNLFKDIKSLFVGEEACETVPPKINNLIKYDGVNPDEDGWYTYTSDYTNQVEKFNVPYIDTIQNAKDYNAFFEIKDIVSTGNFEISPFFTYSGQFGSGTFEFKYNNGSLTVSNTWTSKGQVYNIRNYKAYLGNKSYFTRFRTINSSNSTFSFKFRVLVTDDMSMTVNNYEYPLPHDECTTKGGLFGMITNFMSNVGKWFSDLLTGLLEGLKALFIPENDYFSTYFSSLYDFFTEKLGILMYPIDLFLDVLNRFLNLSNDTTGLIHIPEISIPGFGVLVQERSFYLNENWNEGPLLTLYNVYKAFVTCFVGLCLVNLARKKEKEIVEGSTS